MILLLLLILPLLEDEKRPSRPLAKVEWMTSITDCTSNTVHLARPPPGKRCFAIRACQALQNIIPEAWESIYLTTTVYSKIMPPTRRKSGL